MYKIGIFANIWKCFFKMNDFVYPLSIGHTIYSRVQCTCEVNSEHTKTLSLRMSSDWQISALYTFKIYPNDLPQLFAF